MLDPSESAEIDLGTGNKGPSPETTLASGSRAGLALTARSRPKLLSVCDAVQHDRFESVTSSSTKKPFFAFPEHWTEQLLAELLHW